MYKISSPLIQTFYYTKNVFWARIKPFLKCEIVSGKVMGGWTQDGVWLEIWAVASWVLLTNNTNIAYGSRKVKTLRCCFITLPKWNVSWSHNACWDILDALWNCWRTQLHLPPHQASGKLGCTANKWSSAQQLVHNGVDYCVAGRTLLVLS